MKLISEAFKDGEYIPAKYSKRGGNISPPLSFIDIAVGTKSLAVICHDPDSVRDFTHWVMWGINPMTVSIMEGYITSEIQQGINDANLNEWHGPQPPSGTHRYVFELYAIDTVLDLPSNTTRKSLENAMNGHITDTATLTGLFSA